MEEKLTLEYLEKLKGLYQLKEDEMLNEAATCIEKTGRLNDPGLAEMARALEDEKLDIERLDQLLQSLPEKDDDGLIEE